MYQSTKRALSAVLWLTMRETSLSHSQSLRFYLTRTGAGHWHVAYHGAQALCTQ